MCFCAMSVLYLSVCVYHNPVKQHNTTTLYNNLVYVILFFSNNFIPEQIGSLSKLLFTISTPSYR